MRWSLLLGTTTAGTPAASAWYVVPLPPQWTAATARLRISDARAYRATWTFAGGSAGGSL